MLIAAGQSGMLRWQCFSRIASAVLNRSSARASLLADFKDAPRLSNKIAMSRSSADYLAWQNHTLTKELSLTIRGSARFICPCTI